METVSAATPPPTEAARGGRRDELLVAALFLAAALALRSISFVYSVHNYDESMYILMGSELAKGHLPYTTLCDLKPFGLFGLFALITSLPLDGVIAARLCAALTVGLTAYMLSRIAAHLFGDADRTIGLGAGLAYILFSLADGGMAAQSEIFHNAFAVLGLLIVLGAVRTAGGPGMAHYVAAGLVLGIGLQIKQSVLFDMLAFFAGFFILTTPRPGDLPARVRATLPGLAALGATSLLPTLAVILTYVAAGRLDAWIAGNITTHQVFYGADRPFALDPALWSAWEQAPLWLGALLAVLLSPWLARGDGGAGGGQGEGRAVAFLAIWVASLVLGQLFLRIAADHYFIQFLPPLSLLTGLALGRGLLTRLPGRPLVRRVLGTLVILGLFAVAKNPLIHSLYVLKDRLVDGETWAGDTPRRIAADLRPALEPGDAIYVVGFQPLVYYLVQAEIATRFAFTGLPNRDVPGRDGCAWVPQDVEMQRIVNSRPRFIVVERGIFFHELRPGVKGILTEALASSYRLRASYDQHFMHHVYPFERFVMNGGAPADVYELVDDPAPAA